jgi:hypothetical protein
MFGGNRQGRREGAIERRLKNLQSYAASSETDKGRKAYKDIACTCRNLKIEVPADARSCLSKLKIEEKDIVTIKAKRVEAEEQAVETV